jgi:hypothetical protein
MTQQTNKIQLKQQTTANSAFSNDTRNGKMNVRYRLFISSRMVHKIVHLKTETVWSKVFAESLLVHRGTGESCQTLKASIKLNYNDDYWLEQF